MQNISEVDTENCEERGVFNRRMCISHVCVPQIKRRQLEHLR